jgi:hypothetical protein
MTTTYTYGDINFPGSVSTTAVGINNSGEVSGFFYDGITYHPFTYLNGTFNSEVFRISASIQPSGIASTTMAI